MRKASTFTGADHKTGGKGELPQLIRDDRVDEERRHVDDAVLRIVADVGGIHFALAGVEQQGLLAALHVIDGAGPARDDEFIALDINSVTEEFLAHCHRELTDQQHFCGTAKFDLVGV